MKEMTKYEKLVADKTIPPCNSLDWLMIGSTVEDLIKGKDKLDDYLFEALEGLSPEIEHLYLEQPEILQKFNTIMDNYRNIKNV